MHQAPGGGGGTTEEGQRDAFADFMILSRTQPVRSWDSTLMRRSPQGRADHRSELPSQTPREGAAAPLALINTIRSNKCLQIFESQSLDKEVNWSIGKN